jgi:P63C domain
MSTEIVTNELPENIAREFSVDADGKIFVSKKGLARLCGVHTTLIARLLEGGHKSGLEMAEVQTTGGLKVVTKIPDTMASEIILHYAFQGRKQAQETTRLLGAIGLRVFGQKLLNYRPVEKRTLSQAEIIELCCLPVPSEWQRRFPEEYYDNLSRLTKLTAFGNSRPTLWAQLTKELVYDWLPEGVYTEVKRCKSETGGYDKLHQFLSADGLQILEQHQRTLLTLMTASATMQQLRLLLQQSCSGSYQLLLIESTK